jgi:hypothetical protein
MEQYDTRGAPDPFARSVSAFESLTATLSGTSADGWTHTELKNTSTTPDAP